MVYLLWQLFDIIVVIKLQNMNANVLHACTCMHILVPTEVACMAAACSVRACNAVIIMASIIMCTADSCSVQKTYQRETVSHKLHILY